MESTFENGWRMFRTSFGELGSRLFIEGDVPGAASPRPAEPQGRNVLTLPAGGWRIRRDEPNVLVLDHGRFRIDGGEWSEKLFFIKLDAALRALLGKPPRGGSMLQPYITAGRKPERTLNTELEFAFSCRELPKCDVALGIERPDLYAIEINGETLEKIDVGEWADPAVRKLKLPAGMLRIGENRITLRCDYHEMLPGIEALFILGDFGVRDDAIVELPDTVAMGDWCEQGFPHYAGNFTYVRNVTVAKTEGGRAVLPRIRRVARRAARSERQRRRNASAPVGAVPTGDRRRTRGRRQRDRDHRLRAPAQRPRTVLSGRDVAGVERTAAVQKLPAAGAPTGAVRSVGTAETDPLNNHAARCSPDGFFDVCRQVPQRAVEQMIG